MVLLEPDGRVELPGVVVRSAGVRADVDAQPLTGVSGAERDDPANLADRLAGEGVPERGARALGAAIAAQDMRPVLVVPLDGLATTGAGDGARAPGELPAVALEVDAPADDEGQVMLEVDATGVVAWHFPEPATGGPGGGVRAAGGQTFRIPVRQADVPGESPDAGAAADRGIFGVGVRKLLQLVRYPVERVAAGVGTALVGAWESRARPYAVRLVDASGFERGGAGAVLTGAEWAALDGRPALLFVHGTFSTARSAFAGLADDAALMAELRRRYDDRVIAFDHPSLHVDPAENVRRLLSQVPPGVQLVLDVVSHSRGGLVSRALSLPSVAADAGRRPPVVRTLVHVATPNAGTVLADPQRWGTLLDTVTNLAMLFPDDAVSVPLTAVVEVVKQVGTGMLDGLDGLAAMNPTSRSLAALATAAAGGSGAARQFAVASDFRPDTAPLPVRALDLLVDPFFGEGNDLVVPTAGVSAVPGIAADDVLRVPRTPALSHVAFFRDTDVRRRIAEWLPAGG